MSSRRKDDPLPLREAVAAVGRDLGLPDPDALSAFINAWPNVVGVVLAQHTSVRSVRGGVCTIEVDGPMWATELRYRERELAARAREVCGTTVVTSIRVVVAGPGKTIS